LKKAGIVTFALGTPDSIQSNKRLALISMRKARLLKAPIYTQRDFGVDPQPGIFITYTEEEPGKPPPTFIIARGAVQWAKARGIKELWIVCARPHLKRCKRDLEYAIQEVYADITVRVCEGILMFPAHEWFCEDSTQVRTTSLKEWWLREFIATHIPMWLYIKKSEEAVACD
jgi:hypothetical protein